MRRIATSLGGLVLVLVVLAIAQLVLPGLAAQSLRDTLSKSGRVLSVEVSAFPAIELLWHDADRVVVRMAGFRSSAAHLTRLLEQSSGVARLRASVGTLRSGLLTLRDATLVKHGATLFGTARLEESDLRAALPILDSVRFLGDAGGAITLQGTASAFGVGISVPATIRPQAGRLVVSPDVPFGGLATITVFSDPRVDVESVSGHSVPGGMEISAQGRLR